MNNQELIKELISKKIFASGIKSDAKMDVLCESKYIININNTELVRGVCSPRDIEEMVIGRIITEACNISETDIISVNINEAENITFEEIPKSICSFKKIPQNNFILSDKVVFALINDVFESQKLHQMTKGAHCTSIISEGTMLKSFEDIGRHNTIDKAVGFMLKNNIPFETCIFYYTGRVMVETLEKLYHAGIYTLITKAVPTNEAAMYAREKNIRLICRAWPDSFEII